MSFDVLVDHIFSHVPCAPSAVANGPEVSAPVFLPKMREFILEEAGCSSLEALHDLRDGKFGWIFDVHVHMVGAHRSLEDADVFRIAGLDQELSAALLHLPFENVVAIFGDPDHMDSETREGMAAMPVGIGHSRPC